MGVTRFDLDFDLESVVDLPGGGYRHVKEICLELIGDQDGMQVNVMDQGGIATRLQIKLEGNKVVAHIWRPENWSNDEPDQKITVYEGSLEDPEAKEEADEEETEPE